jgi:hypothetical protein
MRGNPMSSLWKLLAVIAFAIISVAFARTGAAESVAPNGTPAGTAAQAVTQVAASTTGQTDGENLPAVYLVVGSFRLIDNVERMIDDLDGLNAVMSIVFVKEKVYFRVLVGPLTDAEMDSARNRLVDYGINNPWTIDLCSDDLTPPPCEPGGNAAAPAGGITVASN